MKIGIFDSGYGGLSVFRNIAEQLPEYDYIYLGDNARTPYGNRSFETIFHFSKQCIDQLFARDCKLIVIACNTASAKALRNLQQIILPAEYPDRKILGIIRPSVEALTSLLPESKNREIALWATQGTVDSMSYPLELAKISPDLHLIQQACPMLVPLVEAGECDGAGLDYFVEKYWRQTLEKSPAGKIDVLLLACTHYPLLYAKIRSVIPHSVKIIEQGDLVATGLADYLQRHPEVESVLSREQNRRFLTTDQTERFDHLAEIFLGKSVLSERIEI
jgi:glutamate racemase